MRKAKIEDATRGEKCYSVGGVAVTVYVESSHTHKNKRRCLKPKPPIDALTRRMVTSSDRRAELLAYSLCLRSSTSQESIHNSDIRPKPRAKWKWSLPLRKLQHAFSRVLRKDRAWRYERIETQGTAKRYQWCHPRQMTCNEAKRKTSRMFKKLWTVWRGCCRWKCNKVKLYK